MKTFKILKYVGEVKHSSSLLANLTQNKEYPCTLVKIGNIKNYEITNDIGKVVLISNNNRRENFKSY